MNKRDWLLLGNKAGVRDSTSARQAEGPSSSALLSFACGILSLFSALPYFGLLLSCFYVITLQLAVTAILLGHIERKNIHEGHSSLAGNNYATVGFVLGIISATLNMLGLAFFILAGIILPLLMGYPWW